MLHTKNAHIGYLQKKKEISIAENININIHENELVAIIGINGAGKSTLLKSLTKDIPLLAGQAHLHHRDLSSYSHKELSENIGLVLTHQAISKNLSVAELIALGRQPYTNWLGQLSQTDTLKVNQSIQQVGLKELANRKCHSLSDGQLQKVLIARALAQNTRLIFMDEPTTHLDLYHKAYVLQLLKKLSKTTQKAIVFATHEINLALQLCDQIILIDQGKVIQGTPEELIKKNVFSSLFPEELIRFDPASKSFILK